MSNEPRWVTEARRYIGMKEIKGPKHEPRILQMWRDIKRGGIKDDENPWCAAFCGACLENSGIESSRFESAKSYLKWGISIPNPVIGCIAVMGRSGGGGHVGFVVATDKLGNLMVLGGNQSDSVSIAAFPNNRVLSYRWPAGEPLPSGELPVMAIACKMSQSEA